MSGLALSAALTVNERTRALLDGSVAAAGIRLRAIPMEPAEMFWRQLAFAEFDVSEMSLSGLAAAVSRGDTTWVALPVYTVRRFYHTQLLVRADAAIASPADLRGKRAGVPEYVQTSVVWARGVLQDEYGVRPSDLTWFMERTADRSLGGETGFTPPPDLSFTYLGAQQSLDRMMLDGEIDVLFHYITANNLVDRSRIDLRRHPAVRPLYPDVPAEAARYYRATGVFPLNHCVVVRRAILERHPWVALNVYAAFVAAGEQARARALATIEPHLAAGVVAGDLRRELGRDLLAYGFANSRAALEILLRYLVEQGLVARPVAIEQLFAASTLGV